MRISVSVTDYSWRENLSEELAQVARVADEAGLDSLWVPDHLMQAAPGSDPDSAMLECYATLGYLAAVTTRIRLGTLVTAVTYRPAAILVKAVTTLDVLSGGRAWLGVGAGYLEEEARRFAVPLPAVKERFDALEATLQTALAMWQDTSPPPASRPHPPILIGGTGERRTLLLVARYADACNLFDIPDGGATVRHKLDVLRRHCDAVGRDFDSIEKTLSTRLTPDDSPEVFAERMASLGIDHAILLTQGPWEVEDVRQLAAYTRETS
jgi:alkanesulfonate monooxygenase SsuD/methylene tetrahydromethanopterin reductase-like flavin-dependent oxidoreductase (luciferase family)